MALSAFVRRWMNRKGFASQRSRQMATRPARRRPRLHLEALEDRSVPSTVMNLNDSGPDSLRQAILDTPAGGTVDFQSGLTGTIPLTSGELAISKDLTIAGPGASVITVSGNQVSRVFDIAAAVNAAISGLTIADGFNTNFGGGAMNVFGGGIMNAGTLTLAASTLSGNSVSVATFIAEGGGLYNASSGTLTVSGCTLSGNSAISTTTLIGGSGSAQGGGIYNAGTLTVTNSTLSGNSATSVGPVLDAGGGIYNSGGTVSISNSTLVNNVARSSNGTSGFGGANGGGIFSNGTLTITASTLSGNSAGNSTTAASNGGGIDNLGTLTVSDSVVTGNTVRGAIFASSGGGIATATGVMPATIIRSTISGNSAPIQGYGGGIGNGGILTVIDCTISGNMAGIYGGGIRNVGTLTVSTCTLSGNTSTAGGGGGIYDDSSGRLTVTASTISGNSATSPFLGFGGGIDINTGGMLTLGNTIVAGNTGLASPDVAGTLSSTCAVL
jgi:hypothetical protein